jgi:hypothetical protein
MKYIFPPHGYMFVYTRRLFLGSIFILLLPKLNFHCCIVDIIPSDVSNTRWRIVIAWPNSPCHSKANPRWFRKSATLLESSSSEARQ